MVNHDYYELVLLCEYAQTPLGVESAAPRFSWKGEGALCTKMQTSYHITLWSDQGSVWDSGIVKSSQSSAVVYHGPALQSATRYFWQVEITVQGEQMSYRSEPTWFETGLLTQQDWKGAAWIGHPAPQRGVAPMFRRAFRLDNKPNNARLYFSGLGYAEVTVNGKPTDGSYLDPGWTDYQKTVLYRAWDVTELLQEGENVLAVTLGEGWYGNDHPNFLNLIGSMPSWLGTPKLLCLLQADDACFVSADDGQWLVSDGPIRQNNIYDGQWYDARLEKDSWQTSGYVPDHTQWQPVVEVSAPGGRLRCQQMQSIGKKCMMEPVCIVYPDDGDAYEVVADMGINIAGWAQVTAYGKPGQKIQLRYAETLNPNGSVNQGNLRGAKAVDTFIIGKEGSQTYEPHFTYHGFRYVQVKTDPGVIVTQIRGWQVHTLVEQTGHFLCSNDLLNRTYRAILQTEQNNLHSVPTDCPQRDERLGWINDMTVRSEEGLYNFDMILLYEKWLRDIADAQDPVTGAIPDTAPYFFGGSPACHVSSVYVLLPWQLYQFYRDTRAIEQHFDGMERYVAFKQSQRDEKGLISQIYFGDWAPPMTEAMLGWGENAVPITNPQQLVTTCYLYYDCLLMEKMSELLGFHDKALKYHQMQQDICACINREYFHEDHYAQNAQGSNVFPLYLDIVPREKRAAVVEQLLYDLFGKRSGRLSTGNQMTKYLYEVFNQEGLHQQAYALATHKGYPSISFMMDNGATTIWERWEKMAGNHMNSHNHPMLGAYTIWFQKGLCGLNPESRTDTGELLLKPNLVEAMTFAEGKIHTPQGTVALSWRKQEDGLQIQVEVPWNTTVSLKLPVQVNGLLVDGEKAEASSVLPGLVPGSHTIVCEF